MLGIQLIFDPTSADTIASSSHVGSHTLAGNGTLIGAVSDALKVNFSNTSIAVTATDLDIRDLSFATDSVDVSGSAVSISGDVNVTQGTSPWVIGDGGGSITVDASNLDVRDLAAASDSVAAWVKDGTGTAIGSVGDALKVNVVNDSESIASSFLATAVSVDDTVGGTALPATPLALRKKLSVQCKTGIMYLGGSGVTAAAGVELKAGGTYDVNAGPAAELYAICASGKTAEARVLEAA